MLIQKRIQNHCGGARIGSISVCIFNIQCYGHHNIFPPLRCTRDCATFFFFGRAASVHSSWLLLVQSQFPRPIDEQLINLSSSSALLEHAPTTDHGGRLTSRHLGSTNAEFVASSRPPIRAMSIYETSCTPTFSLLAYLWQQEVCMPFLEVWLVPELWGSQKPSCF